MICKQCGASFSPRTVVQKFCSKKCCWRYHKTHDMWRERQSITFTCAKCGKVIVEFLRVNHWVRRWLPMMDFSEYTVKQSGYSHLPLESKIKYLSMVTGFRELTVCDDVTEHYEYWKNNINSNPNDCCNLRM